MLVIILWKIMSHTPEPLSPSWKTMSLWVFCNHTVNLKSDSVLDLTETKIYSFYCKAQKWLKEKAPFNNSNNNSHRNHTNTIFCNNIFGSSAVLVGWRDLGGIKMRQSVSVSHRRHDVFWMQIKVVHVHIKFENNARE